MHAMTDTVQTWAFLTAGNATVTIRSAKTGTRFTYKVRRKPGTPMFVSLLSGPSNEEDFQYLGLLTSDANFRLTRKSRCNDDTPSVKAFRFFLRRLAGDSFGADLEVFHEGRCGRCGRKLTVPESIVSGIGPECAGKVVGG